MTASPSTVGISRRTLLVSRAKDELTETAIWGVVRFTVRWHVARAGQGR